MRTMIVKDGKAINAVLAGDGWEPPDGTLAVASETAAIGDSFDGEAFVGPAAEPPSPDVLLGVLKREAGSVIGAVVSTTAQLNLNAAMNVIGAKPTSQRSAEERAFTETFAEGHAWIQAVRARVPELVATAGITPEGEERWPQPSQAVRALAAAY